METVHSQKPLQMFASQVHKRRQADLVDYKKDTWIMVNLSWITVWLDDSYTQCMRLPDFVINLISPRMLMGVSLATLLTTKTTVRSVFESVMVTM